MKVWAVTKLARQQDGEYCLVMIEKIFKSQQAAESYIQSVKSQAVMDVPTAFGEIKCLVERGIIECEIEE